MTFTAGIIHLSQSEVLRPGLTETEFRLGNVGSKAEIFFSNPPHISYKLSHRTIEEKEFNVIAFFENGMLIRVTLARPVKPGETWAKYDRQMELSWAKETKMWVELLLNHCLPMQLPWGTLDCNFDPRSGSGSLTLSYHISKRQTSSRN